MRSFGQVWENGIRFFAVLVSLLAAGLCTSGYAAGPPLQQGPVAVVTDVDGKASNFRSGRAHALAVLEALDRSDQLRLEAHARVEIAFTAGRGRVFSLSGPGRFALRADDVVGMDAGSRIVMRDLAGLGAPSGSDRAPLAVPACRCGVCRAPCSYCVPRSAHNWAIPWMNCNGTTVRTTIRALGLRGSGDRLPGQHHFLDPYP